MRIRVMTFNIRFDTPQDEASGNRWPARVESVVETVRRCAPDVEGFQEALRSQLSGLTEALPEYRAVGKPREAGDVGEYVPLFFDRDRFAAPGYGDFWLSTTPEVEGSLGWDAPDPRHCTWAELEERASGQRFAVFNTHLDRWGELARLEGARLIVTRTQLAAGLPFLVMGDLNAGEDSEPLEVLRAAGLVDTFRCIHPDATEVGTVHHEVLVDPKAELETLVAVVLWTLAALGVLALVVAGLKPGKRRAALLLAALLFLPIGVLGILSIGMVFLVAAAVAVLFAVVSRRATSTSSAPDA
jgi:endonuclease/exonuclease/phosphatase family metal-dependent hydrolase